MKSGSVLLTVLLGVAALGASAAGFNGSRPLVCATMTSHACRPGSGCNRSLPTDIRAARLLSIDFEKKAINRPAHATDQYAVDRDPGRIVAEGIATGAGWARHDSGASMIASSRDAFVLFGNCIAL
ncbi:hypothetical protein [Paraburkholderia saeva]|uniref:Uncharacterized protein n=1 Tax=Paraburkholderia saeva TaxID=2777537 RepID=A0A9N8RYP6_9BURK|nr:hypothetical protein [Paraburkholderia saeva]CAG4904545.1 hypothetical protein LMG31841_03362 [Paraburkholderia saeva]